MNSNFNTNPIFRTNSQITTNSLIPISLKSLFKLMLIIFLTVTLFAIRFSMYQKSVHPTGLDGYYYALQAKSFAETGSLENPDIKCAYYICGIFAKLTKDPIKAVKLWDAASSAFTSLGAFLVLFILTENFYYSLLAFLLVSVSPLFTLMGINYISNQTGLMFLFFFIAGILKTEKSSYKLIWISLSTLLFILTCLSHKVTLVFAIIFLLFFALTKLKKLITKIFRNKIVLISSASIIAITCIFLSLFFIRHLPRFQNAFSLPSLKLFNNNFLQNVFTEYGILELFFYYIAAYLILCLTIILFIISLQKKSETKNILQANKLIFLLSIPILYFPFWNLNRDMGTRLIQNSVTLSIPLLLYIIYYIPIKKIILNIFITISIITLFFVQFLTPNLYNPKKDPPFSIYQKVIEQIELPDDSLLIAHLGLNHVYTYYKNLRDCLNWNCDFEVKNNEIWRIAYGVNINRIKRIILENKEALIISNEEQLSEILENEIKKLPYDYILIKENLWNLYLQNEDKEISETLCNWFNPHEVRPGYIRRK